MEIVRRHDLQSIFLRPALKHLADDLFLRQPVILHFQIEIVLAENAHQPLQRLPGSFFVAVEDILLNMSLDAGAHGDKPFMVLLQQVVVDAGLVVIVFSVDKALRHDFDQIMIALQILRQQDQMA